jgi:hypothetical protein
MSSDENITSDESSIENEDYFLNENVENNTESIDAQEIFNLLNQQNMEPINYNFTSRQYFNLPTEFFPFTTSQNNQIYSLPNFERINFTNSINTGIRNIFEEMYPILLSEVIDYIENDIVDEVMERTLNESVVERNENDFIEFVSENYNELSEENKNTKDCSICLVDFEDDDSVSLTNCKHLFHNNCITEWSRYKKDCPICRTKLKDEINEPI